MEQDRRTKASPTVKQSVESQFGQVAANYAESIVHRQGDEFAEMLRICELTGNEHVLDAGCGAGHTALTFAPHVAQVTAIDLTPPMLEAGRLLAHEKSIDNVEFELGDVEQLAYDDDTFDRIVTRYSAHHWPEPEKALAEFKRVLKSNADAKGMLLIVDVLSYRDYIADSHLQTIEILRDASHVRDHTPEQWLEMLNAAGFDAELHMEWPLWMDFDSWVLRMQTPADNVAIIQKIMSDAPDVVRDKLLVESNGDFSFRSGLIVAIPMA